MYYAAVRSKPSDRLTEARDYALLLGEFNKLIAESSTPVAAPVSYSCRLENCYATFELMVKSSKTVFDNLSISEEPLKPYLLSGSLAASALLLCDDFSIAAMA